MSHSMLAALAAFAVGVLPMGALADEAPAGPTGEGGPGPTEEGEAGGIALERVAGADRVETAIAIAELKPGPISAAVLAGAGAFADALVGAPLAGALDAPLLLTGPSRLDERVAAALERLAPERVVLLGGEKALAPEIAETLAEDYAVERVAGADRFATAAAVARRLGEPDGAYVATGMDFADALAIAPLAVHTARPILLTWPESLPESTAGVLDELEPDGLVVLGGPGAVSEEVAEALATGDRIVRRVAGSDRYATAVALLAEAEARGMPPQTLWLATGADFPDALAAGPAAGAAGQPLLLVSGHDLCAAPAPAAALEDRGEHIERLRLLGGPATLTAGAASQLAVIADPERACQRLPRGGAALFPDFRVVAHYGSHATPRMGILGHGTPDEAAQRLLDQAAAYEVADRLVLPAMELIAVIANRHPGPDGLYRTPVEETVIQRYLDAARRVDALLVLDIQPGHSDFLTELRRYERFLREPDVGVALDPEWRMSDGGVPGERVGWVHADEINAVSAYLAEIVASEDLPEKLFILHQFRHDMIRDRHLVVDRDELAVTIHADGFGGREIKRRTYEDLSVEPPLFNGFKLFYEQDTHLFEPADVLGFLPRPDLVSYQ